MDTEECSHDEDVGTFESQSFVDDHFQDFSEFGKFLFRGELVGWRGLELTIRTLAVSSFIRSLRIKETVEQRMFQLTNLLLTSL